MPSPHPNGISETMSPKEIITGFKVDFTNHCKLKFGDYMQTHEEHNNDMRTHPIDALQPGITKVATIFIASQLDG